MKTYTIIISDEQRESLRDIIDAHPAMTAENMPLEYWPDMLRKLPADEAEAPGCHHGFCL